MARVAFIGLGKMGLEMARSLLRVGHDLRVHNRTASRAELLARGGARTCATPREACSGVEAVIAMTADDTSSRSVWLGSDGILAAQLAPGTLAIECSTLSYDWVIELAAAARSVLNGFSERALRFGGVGAGTAFKLIINMVGAVQIASIAEGVAVAERAGLDLTVVGEAIATGQAASPQVIRNSRRMIEADHERNVVFTPKLRLKDVQYALRFARRLGIGAPFAQLAAHQLRQLCEFGHPQVNESKIIEVARIQPPEA